MRILSILGKGIKSIIDEATTPELLNINQKFEEYVLAQMFISDSYAIVKKTHDYHANKNSPQYSLMPDFLFRDKLTGKEFFVEAKFRTGDCHGKIIWCDDKQLVQYNECSKERPFFLILGMGEKPGHPELISLIPLSKANHTALFYSLVDEYEIDPGISISSKTLWSR